TMSADASASPKSSSIMKPASFAGRLSTRPWRCRSTSPLAACCKRSAPEPPSLPPEPMDQIAIVDLEVFYRVGVPDEERAQPQRLLLTLEMEWDFRAASTSDRLEDTIDYFNVAQRLLRFGDGHSWRLIEKLASDLADLVLAEYRPRYVRVEVKKFPIPQ